ASDYSDEAVAHMLASAPTLSVGSVVALPVASGPAALHDALTSTIDPLIWNQYGNFTISSTADGLLVSSTPSASCIGTNWDDGGCFGGITSRQHFNAFDGHVIDVSVVLTLTRGA